MSEPKATSSAQGARARTRRIGLFGGSFDPVHAGHLHAARAALDAFQLDRVVFVPAAAPPHKPGRRLADGQHRLAMLELATSSEPRFSVSSIELQRGGDSYTIDTVRALPAAIGEPADCAIHLILGSDNLVGFSGWRDAAALIDRVQPIVIHREGDDGERSSAIRRDDRGAGSASSSGEEERALSEIAVRFGAARAEKVRRGCVSLPPVRLSATSLRRRLANGVDVEGDLIPSVRDYIDRHALYRPDPPAVAPERA